MFSHNFSMKIFACFLLLINWNFTHALQSNQRPNIVIIMADDMGFDDISFRGSNEFLTPNIDALAYSGVTLKNFYTASMCTPSRAALLTGKYPIHTGMQHYVIPNFQPFGLSVNETIISQIFKENGYFTSLLGKWHMGMSRMVYTPTYRGFDYHFGYLGSYIDYYNHTLWALKQNYYGHDFRRNLNVTHEFTGTYATHLINDAAVQLIHNHNYEEKPLFMILSHLAPHTGNENEPLQAPPEEVNKFAYIKNPARRIYAAMMSIFDESVGAVIDALDERKILDNTIVLFFSDNGAPTQGLHANSGSNYPLRGQKNAPWEGAMRSSCAIWTTALKNPGAVWSQHVYIADLLPSLASAAGIKISTKVKLDGVDIWGALLEAAEESTFKREIMHNIDEISDYVAYFDGKYKFVNGTTVNGTYDQWYGQRKNLNSNVIDPRAKHYEAVITNTTVWRKLQAHNTVKRNVDIAALRASLDTKCKYDGTQKSNATCSPLKSPCFFDIENDPCEQDNLYGEPQYRDKVSQMLNRIEVFRRNAIEPRNKPEDKLCDPQLYDNEWTWWEDLQNEASFFE